MRFPLIDDDENPTGNDRFFRELEREQELRAFYAEQTPCEACGRPAEKRYFSEEMQLWIGLDCACNAEPDAPLCEYFKTQLRLCGTVTEVQRLMARHIPTCAVCNHNRKEVGRETEGGETKRRAA